MLSSLLLCLVSLCCTAAVPLEPRFPTVSHCGSECQHEAKNTIMEKVMPEKKAFFDHMIHEMEENHITFDEVDATACVNGKAGEFPCKGIDLVHFLPYSAMSSARKKVGNDIWGWTDPETKTEYVLSGQYAQTVILEIVNGKLVPLASIARAASTWSDIKVYKNHMYIGTEGGKGIQVYDLTQVRSMERVEGKIHSVQPDSVYIESITQSHNVVINEETGYLYVVGSRRTCSGGLHVVDIREPGSPKFAGCYSGDGYTHDAECVVYRGPDERYKFHEICFNYNENSLTIVDMDDKSNPKLVSRTPYKGSQYTHQGWCTEDHQFLLLDDELDEQRGRNKHTHTLLWDIRDLENPIHHGDYYAAVKSIDHNLYVRDNLAYESNYGSGLRVLDLSAIEQGKLTEVAYFDVHPKSEWRVGFVGAWSSYIYFESGYIPVSSIERGVFLLKRQ